MTCSEKVANKGLLKNFDPFSKGCRSPLFGVLTVFEVPAVTAILEYAGNATWNAVESDFKSNVQPWNEPHAKLQQSNEQQRVPTHANDRSTDDAESHAQSNDGKSVPNG